ncbi:MAG: DUF2510 domain-containing protein [Iamia sp.]
MSETTGPGEEAPPDPPHDGDAAPPGQSGDAQPGATDPPAAPGAGADLGSSGWYPDPAGRYEHRWWDGQAWTGQVSRGGTAEIDPSGGAPVTPDRSVLDATDLAFDLTLTQFLRNGVWQIWDRSTNAHLGWMQVNHGGGFSMATYALHDAEGRHVLSLVRPRTMFGLELDVFDHLGQRVARAKAQGSIVSLMAAHPDHPASEVVWATTSALRTVPGPRDPVWKQSFTELVDHAGRAIGRLDLTVPRRGGGPGWLYLHRTPEAPPPLRVLCVICVPFLALLSSETRRVQG